MKSSFFSFFLSRGHLDPDPLIHSIRISYYGSELHAVLDLRGDADQMLSDSWGESFGLNAQFRGHKGMVEAARYLICFGCMPHGNDNYGRMQIKRTVWRDVH
jgi:hypothetical protein